MSASRRQSSGEDNILARLEREGKRGTAAKSWKSMNTTVAWCGLASLAVIGLIAVLASLTKENMAVHDGPIVVEARVPADRYADADGNGFAPLPAVGAPPRKSALVVDEPMPGSKLRSTETSRVPPMVMLKPAGPVQDKSAGVAAKPAARSAAAVAAKSPAPAKVAAASPAKSAARPAPVRLAAKAAPPKPAPVKVTAPAPQRVLAAMPPRPKKAVSVPAAKPEASPMDSDVALLSAIIMHASRHAAERAQIEAQNCPIGKKCAASKTTD